MPEGNGDGLFSPPLNYFLPVIQQFPLISPLYLPVFHLLDEVVHRIHESISEPHRELAVSSHHHEWNSGHGSAYPIVVLRVKNHFIPNCWKAITLKMGTFEDTGAVIAAATTSIPEAPDSGRNWDYRFCWPRDAAIADGAKRIDLETAHDNAPGQHLYEKLGYERLEGFFTYSLGL